MKINRVCASDFFEFSKLHKFKQIGTLKVEV